MQCSLATVCILKACQVLIAETLYFVDHIPFKRLNLLCIILGIEWGPTVCWQGYWYCKWVRRYLIFLIFYPEATMTNMSFRFFQRCWYLDLFPVSNWKYPHWFLHCVLYSVNIHTKVRQDYSHLIQCGYTSLVRTAQSCWTPWILKGSLAGAGIPQPWRPMEVL